MSDSVILLNRCQNPYKVRANRSELPECEAFKRQVLYILNRLSPENYNKLVIEFLNLPLDCEQSLKDCVELIWFKCLVDHIYSSMYAKLCRVMSETRVELQFMPDKYISFGAALVKQCQREFYRDFKSHIDIDGYNEKIRRAISDRDENRRIEIESELSERVSQARHEYIGNLIFMSELFKLDMIEERLLFDGVEAVFKRVNEESLENIEFISMLIILVAPKLKKRTESIKVLDEYVERLRLWASLTKPRHRFAIMDVVEMKARNWTPTSPAKSSNLHRLEEIRAKFESEQELFAKNQTYLDSLSDMDSLESSESSLPSFKDMFSFDYAKHVFDEYAVRNDAAHAFKDIESLKSIDIKEFVRDLISISFYKDARSRQSIGELFYKCLKGSLLNHEHFGNGLKLFFHSLCEREEDADNDSQTNVSTQIGQFLSQLFQIDYIILDCLKPAFDPLSNRKLGCEIICETLKQASERLNCQIVRDILDISGINVRSFVNGCPNGLDILKRTQLEWSLVSIEKSSQIDPVDVFKRRLNRLMKSSSRLEIVISIFSSSELASEQFLAAFVEVAFEKCDSESNGINYDRFKSVYLSILRKLIDNNLDKQLIVLYAVQSFGIKNKQSSEFFKSAFDMLYSEKLINEEIFFKWKNEPKGRAHGLVKFALRDFLLFKHE